ncbi:hypothetical protein [Actinoplanes sp. NPDC049316]|uniref:hypothetical protein n=1 Tax=Actinoplanes sp. NPDC049316 TaxID=3154727 RepID=UPI00342BD48E
MPLTQIDEYEVMYSANTFSPRIWLKHQGAYIGQLVFKPDGATLPPDTADSVYYHAKDFPNVVDLLRNEKPMYLLFSGSGGGFENGIKTTAEMTGEAEGV